jgi:hypothetical protein
MVWHVAVELNDIAAQGRDYPWQRPEPCLRCGRFRVWGHGFVERYFEGFAQAILLKCYRRPGCGCVVTSRPQGYFRRIRSSVESIRLELRHRLEQGRWPSTQGGASRKWYWLRNLRRQALAWFGWADEDGLVCAFDRLVEAGVVPVGRAIRTENRIGADPPQ